jgi:hypothetical protein
MATATKRSRTTPAGRAPGARARTAKGRMASRASRVPPSRGGADLELEAELRRQHTLLQMMAERMRESATAWEVTGGSRGPRLRRALDVHRRFLIEVHQTDEEELLAVARELGPPAVRAAAAKCAQEHPRAAQFERSADELLGRLGSGSSSEAGALSALFREEAERIERHHLFDEEPLYAHLSEWLPPSERARITASVRRRDGTRADAEGMLVSWSAQLHGSSD